MTGEPRHICFVMLYYDARHTADISRYLARTPIHQALPQELAARGHRVDVVHLWPYDADMTCQGVRHHFVRESRTSRALAAALARPRRRDPALYQPAPRAISLVRRLRPDVIHFHGATLNLNLHVLLRLLGRTAPPVVLHYHGGYPAGLGLARRLQRFNFDRSARYCFSTRCHAEPFVQAGVITRPGRIVELMETSSDFQPRERRVSRRETGMHGEPVFLWVGRLHPIKDPLTALRGFERILAAWPEAQLYAHYLTAESLPLLEEYLARRPQLREHVQLRGPAPFERMEAIYNSADFLLQASLREFSGCAVLEAMACGVIPVVTDIPSFRAMTGHGRFGVLFPPGDDASLAGGVLALGRDDLPCRSRAVREHFERKLSFASLAARLESLYLELTSSESGG